MQSHSAHTGSNRRGTGTRVAEWVIVGALALVVLTACFSDTVRDSNVSTSTVMVRQGDTLWDLASRSRVPGLSTAEKADLIADLNSLDTATLVVGSVLKVPAVDAASDVLAMK